MVRQEPIQKTPRGDLSQFVFGKKPPHAIPLEEVVLGAVIMDSNALSIILDILRPESFYLDKHQVIYKAILRLFHRSLPVDMLTVFEELKKKGEAILAGGPNYVASLTRKVASTANIEYHARIIAQKFIQRELIRVSNVIIKGAYEDSTDVFTLLDEAEQLMFQITNQTLTQNYEELGSLSAKTLKILVELKGRKDGLTGVPTGFTSVDRFTSGWQPSDLVILAARPGMGKTSLILTMAKNAALDFEKPVAIFSLEMSSVQLVHRLVSIISEVPSEKMRNGKFQQSEWLQVHAAMEQLSEAPIFIDDTPGINIFELRAKCRRLKSKHDIQMVIIDYLQLMSGGEEKKRGNREQEISAISRSLKGLAKELNVPVIALSQLSRQVETRGGTKRPQLSDLRESGAIEADADMVTFIYRPEYYKILEDEEGQSLKGVAEFIVAKNRHGAIKTIKLRFVKEFAKFQDEGDDFIDSNRENIDDKKRPFYTNLGWEFTRMKNTNLF